MYKQYLKTTCVEKRAWTKNDWSIQYQDIHIALLDIFSENNDIDLSDRDKKLAMRDIREDITLLGRNWEFVVSGIAAFNLKQTNGLPIEMTRMLVVEKCCIVNMFEYYRELEKHRQISRKSVKNKFGHSGKKE